jgi:hypothetical protein
MLIIYILASPVLCWLWLGICFTIVDYALNGAWFNQGEDDMNTEDQRPARLIRYTGLANINGKPELLSYYEPEKNIIYIDRAEAERLPEMVRNRLEMTELVWTKVDTSGVMPKFVEYVN